MDQEKPQMLLEPADMERVVSEEEFENLSFFDKALSVAVKAFMPTITGIPPEIEDKVLKKQELWVASMEAISAAVAFLDPTPENLLSGLKMYLCARFLGLLNAMHQEEADEDRAHQ
jgi:hypothetical protein